MEDGDQLGEADKKQVVVDQICHLDSRTAEGTRSLSSGELNKI